MLDVLSVIFPVFGLIALGYGTVRAGIFERADMRVLGRYVLNIAIPALLFGALAAGPLSQVLNPVYLVCYAVASLGGAAIGYALFAAQGAGGARRGLAALGMGCANSGYFGYPVLLLALPAVAGEALAMNVLVDTLLVLPLGMFLMALSRPPGGRGRVRDLLEVAWDLLRRPMIIGFLAGLFVSGMGWSVPAPVDRLTDMLAASAGALALFVVGGSLAELRIDGDRLFAAEIAAGKLIVPPALAAGAAALLGMAGLVLPADLHVALILSAGMPMLGIFAVMAQDYGHEGLASLALTLATVGAIATLTPLLWILI